MPLFFTSCALKEPSVSQSATILIKTPTMKFYDKGFIKNFPNHTHLMIFSAGTVVLELKIYENRICKDTFECQSFKEFNKAYLDASYEDDFIKNLFLQPEKEIYFKDAPKGILIKVQKD